MRREFDFIYFDGHTTVFGPRAEFTSETPDEEIIGRFRRYFEARGIALNQVLAAQLHGHPIPGFSRAWENLGHLLEAPSCPEYPMAKRLARKFFSIDMPSEKWTWMSNLWIEPLLGFQFGD